MFVYNSGQTTKVYSTCVYRLNFKSIKLFFYRQFNLYLQWNFYKTLFDSHGFTISPARFALRALFESSLIDINDLTTKSCRNE